MEINFANAALIIIDVQNDFCPGGALAVENGDRVITPLNALVSLFADRGGRIAATQDWHPIDHASFAASHENKKPGDLIDLPGTKNQVLWPAHCIMGSRGADFHDDIDLKPVHFIIRKGFRKNLDSYSAFFENDRKTSTGLDGFLKSLSIGTLVLGGLATDYCVYYSAMDAKALGYETIVAGDAVRGVGFPQGSVEKAIKSMKEAGIKIIESGDIE